jgi:hypothetical protein
LAQKLGQLQPFITIIHGPTYIFWANLTPFSPAWQVGPGVKYAQNELATAFGPKFGAYAAEAVRPRPGLEEAMSASILCFVTWPRWNLKGDVHTAFSYDRGIFI